MHQPDPLRAFPETRGDETRPCSNGEYLKEKRKQLQTIQSQTNLVWLVLCNGATLYEMKRCSSHRKIPVWAPDRIYACEDSRNKWWKESKECRARLLIKYGFNCWNMGIYALLFSFFNMCGGPGGFACVGIQEASHVWGSRMSRIA